MLEPILTIGATLRVDEALQHLNEYPAFDFVAVRARVDDTLTWFAFDVADFRWLLQDIDEAQTLLSALELEETQATPAFDGSVEELPAGFEGVIVSGDDAMGYSIALEEAALGTHRGSGPPVKPGSPEAGAVDQQPDECATTTIPVFFATDRSASGEDGPRGMFGAGRAELQFGKIDVSIPPGHERGEIEQPKWWKLEFKADPEKHIVLRSAQRFDETGFLAAMGEHFDETAERAALVFVHGYNVGFDDAVRRTGQIAHDLRFKGAPVLYSWPSANKLLSYTHDENNARWTEPHFTRFLELMLCHCGAETVHVIAHSMGNRVVSESLHALPAGVDTSRLHQLVLAAPDIDADTFEKMAAQFEGKARQITLYASSRDLALRGSKLVHGYQRAGDSEPQVVVVDPVVTIDASRVDTNLMGHSYIGDSKSILADIYHLLDTGAPPEQRRFFLEPAQRGGDRYWLFQV